MLLLCGVTWRDTGDCRIMFNEYNYIVQERMSTLGICFWMTHTISLSNEVPKPFKNIEDAKKYGNLVKRVRIESDGVYSAVD